MKITDIEAIHLRYEDPNIGLFDGSYDDCIIRVHTDAGLVGIAEVESLAPAIQAIITAPPAHNHARGLRELLIGCDPTAPEELWQMMYDSTDYVGRRGLMMHAIGGIDIALWDIWGQAEGKPICELLGGAKRDRLEAYGTIYPMERTPDAVTRQVEETLDRFPLRHLKFAADPWWLEDLDLTASLLQAARQVLGVDRQLIVDAALAYRTAEEGLALLPHLMQAGVLFLEAPLPLDDVAGHAHLAHVGIPLGVGDLGLTHVNEFEEMMDRGGCAICQPDITMVGGFTGLRQIARAARARGKRVIPHGYKTNIEIAANLHFLANHHEAEWIEYSTSRSPLRWETTREPLEIDCDGFVPVPRSSGLGVSLNPAALSRYRVSN
jgi:L-alanine-DL-glutamate epimerase-like enolase superfamily enzyme